jgi:hypothetical protein
MKNLGMLTMTLGVLSTLSSTYFTIVYKQYDEVPIVLFWGLLSGYEFVFAWFWLFSKTLVISYAQKLTIAALLSTTLVWVIMVFANSDSKSILLWALKALNYSGLYFVGLIICYRSRKSSSLSQNQ